MGHLGQLFGDGLHAMGLPGNSTVQQPNHFLAPCLHCSDNRCRHESTAQELMFRARLISFEILHPLLFHFRGRILRGPRRDPRGAPGNAPHHRAAAHLEFRCDTTGGLHTEIKAFCSFLLINKLTTKPMHAI